MWDIAPSLAGSAWPLLLQIVLPLWRCQVVVDPRLDCFWVTVGRIDKSKGSLWTTSMALPVFHALVLSPPDVEALFLFVCLFLTSLY